MCFCHFSIKTTSIQQHQTGDSRINYHADGIDIDKLNTYECSYKEEYANPEMPWVYARNREIIGSHQQQTGSGKQTDHSWAQGFKHRLHQRRVHIFQEYTTDDYHQYERRQHQSRSGNHAAQDSHALAHARILNGSISTIGGTVDAYRSGSHLTNGHYIRKFRWRHPVVIMHHLCLYQRQHAVATTKTENAY